MPVGSRRYAGNSKAFNLTDVNASPVVSGSSTSRYSFSIPSDPPRIQHQLNETFTNFETENLSNSDQKIFTLNTGLLESEPTIVFTSEFHPLYTASGRTEHGSAISIRENARFVNAKVSLEILSQSDEVKKAAKNNVSEIVNYIDAENDFTTQLMRNLNRCLENLDLSTYAIPALRSADSIGSLYEILRKNGYSADSITKFCQTKLWQQSLVEVKKSLLTHTSELTSPAFSREGIAQDTDPFEIADLERQPEGQKRLWLSYYFSAPDLATLVNVNQIDKNVIDLKRFADRVYANLQKTEKSDSSDGSPSRIIDTYSGVGRDVSILSSILFKEFHYSKFLSDRDNVEYLSSKFGYSLKAQNFSVWDHLIGRFSKSALKTPISPTGNGNSLESFSRKVVSTGLDSYNVLTFEKNFIENSNTTPGTYYYIDSCLRTTDGKSFDLSRIDDLIGSVNSSHQTTSTLFEMLGMSLVKSSESPNIVKETFRREDTPSVFDFNSVTERLRSTSGIYVNSFKYDLTRSHITGLDFTTSSGLYFNIPTRLAALICKAAVYPNSVYKPVSDTLKSYLFLLVMSMVDSELKTPSSGHWQGDMYVTQTSQENELIIDELRKRITGLLATVRSSTDAASVEDASRNFRTFPITTGNTLDTVDPRFFDIDRYFGIRTSDGVFYAISQILKEVIQNTDLFLDEKTRYSGITKTTYAYAYFDFILRVISLQTPEELVGAYERNFSYVHPASSAQDSESQDILTFGFLADSQQQVVDTAEQEARNAGSRKTVSVTEVGLLVSKTNTDILNSVFDARLSRTIPNESHKTVKPLTDSYALYKNDDNSQGRQILFYRKYLFDLSSALVSYREFLVKNFDSQLKKLRDLYSLDGDLNESQKNSLLNLSFSEEQLLLSRYIMSEIKDRVTLSSDSVSKIRQLPEFSTIPDGSTDLFPINETDMVSYPILSSYFKSSQFQSEKGSNKRILSVGIPPKLVKKLRTTSRLSRSLKEFIKNGIIRIKIFKVDRLNPHVVYAPKSYLFDVNRYPTRVLNNWNYEDFIDGEFNLLNIPQKITYNDGIVGLCRNFNTAFPSEVYGSYIDQQEKFQIYTNHSISFLCEEYLRWFTGCRFDESRYNNYSQLKKDLENMERQFSSYVNIVRSTSPSPSAVVRASFQDPTSGTTFEIPVSKPYTPTNPKTQQASEKRFVIPMNSTIKTYFENETFLLDPMTYKKRISYPKKFDRVFNVIVDPDDFYVDESITSEETLQALVSIGALRTSTLNNQYSSRDKGPGDVSMDEYFVTIEPIDYEMEYV